MKHIILSADGSSKVYSVPDAVAEDLEHYCLEFSDWLYESPEAEKYRDGEGVCYDESDFIEYLNTRVFPDAPCVFVTDLGFLRWNRLIPLKYRRCPRFNF